MEQGLVDDGVLEPRGAVLLDHSLLALADLLDDFERVPVVPLGDGKTNEGRPKLLEDCERPSDQLLVDERARERGELGVRLVVDVRDDEGGSARKQQCRVGKLHLRVDACGKIHLFPGLDLGKRLPELAEAVVNRLDAGLEANRFELVRVLAHATLLTRDFGNEVLSDCHHSQFTVNLFTLNHRDPRAAVHQHTPSSPSWP
ncbi:hypothetical protein POL68_02030 [Stigmatella sp. ncwal1]|uniref:Uncharacterized protein n=1 Tax=Stigmatella ashevillensis TaxID=2995309 RepID=A0ABT5D302_9BACT|nr:hypothetical protein [Stigmatella ashevillena]MDC0707238.1 hypothetical protein [Stigmatella ashevillena]